MSPAGIVLKEEVLALFERKELLERIFPDCPVEEYEKRYQKAKSAMEKQGIDALFITERENVEYFTGYMTGHWMVKGFPPAVGIIPLDGEPTLVLPSFLGGTAERTAWVRNMRLHPETHTKPRDFPNLVVKTIKEMGLAKGVLGYESGDELQLNMPIVDFEKVRNDLPSSKFVSGGDAIWKCRTIKSSLEIERLEKAASMTMKGYEKARETVKEGMTEIEIAKILKSIFLEEGADGYAPNGLGFFNIRAGPERYAMADCLPSDRKIRKGDVLVMNVGACYRGYHSNMARYAILGKSTKKHEEIHRTMLDAQHAGIDHFKPGIKASEADKYVSDALVKGGFGERGTISGLGLGLDVHEPPYVGVGRKEVIEPGMVITLCVWIYDVKPGGLGVFCYEHALVITQTGNRPLVPMEKEEMWVI